MLQEESLNGMDQSTKSPRSFVAEELPIESQRTEDYSDKDHGFEECLIEAGQDSYGMEDEELKSKESNEGQLTASDDDVVHSPYSDDDELESSHNTSNMKDREVTNGSISSGPEEEDYSPAIKAESHHDSCTEPVVGHERGLLVFEKSNVIIEDDRDVISDSSSINLSAQDANRLNVSSETLFETPGFKSTNATTGQSESTIFQNHESGMTAQEKVSGIDATPESDFLAADSPSPSTTRTSGARNSFSFRESEVNEDLSSAKKKLGATSMAFIERLQGGAQQRKLHVTRSRDLLAAKEKRQLQSISSSSKRRHSSPRLPSEAGSTVVEQAVPPKSTIAQGAKNAYQPFKALPLPETTGIQGSGGDYGVPRVAKRPTTIPRSPLLGSRRQEQVRVKVLDQLKRRESRHLQKQGAMGRETGSLQESFTERSSISVDSESDLIGLQVLRSAGKENKRDHSNVNRDNDPPSNGVAKEDDSVDSANLSAPRLYSTARAEQRATYEAQRKLRELDENTEERKRLNRRIRRIRKELDVLRPSLR